MNIVVIGLGQFGSQIAINLTQRGFSVLAVDNHEEKINEHKDRVSQAVITDSTDEKAMRAIGVDNVDVAIVAMGSNVQSSLLTTSLVQKMNISQIYVRAINPLQERILETMGIENIIDIEREMGAQLSRTISSETVSRYIEISERHSIVETTIPTAFVGKRLSDLPFRTKYRINVIGIKQRYPVITDNGEVGFDTKMSDIPDPNYELKADDIFIIAGTDQNLNKFIKLTKDHG